MKEGEGGGKGGRQGGRERQEERKKGKKGGKKKTKEKQSRFSPKSCTMARTVAIGDIRLERLILK